MARALRGCLNVNKRAVPEPENQLSLKVQSTKIFTFPSHTKIFRNPETRRIILVLLLNKTYRNNTKANRLRIASLIQDIKREMKKNKKKRMNEYGEDTSSHQYLKKKVKRNETE